MLFPPSYIMQVSGLGQWKTDLGFDHGSVSVDLRAGVFCMGALQVSISWQEIVTGVVASSPLEPICVGELLN